MSEELEAIAARDAAIHYCATCGDRYYAAAGDPHDQTVEECDAYLRKRLEATGGKREPGADGHLCWTPTDHHPFVEGPIPDYEEAERDRRALLSMIRVTLPVSVAIVG